jgi:hypothetical protein
MIPRLPALLQAAPSAGPPVLLLAVAAVLAVAALGVSLFAVWRSEAVVLLADARARAGLERCAASIETLRQAVSGLAAELRDLPPPAAALPANPRSGLNLSKRSQALRMHRQGDPPRQIAAALEVPLQEVDLLLKVHRIVIGNL